MKSKLFYKNLSVICILRQEKERWKSLTQTTESSSIATPKKPNFEHSTSVIETVEAVLSEVTHENKLDLLSTLYSRCLTGNIIVYVLLSTVCLTIFGEKLRS